MPANTLRRSLTLTSLLFGALILASCSHTAEPTRGVATANPTIEQDASYRQAVDSHTERHEIINNFKTDAIVQVTLLHPELLRRMSSRHKQLFQDAKDVFPNATDKFSFVVSLYSRDYDSADLADKNYWNIQIFHRGSPSEPVLVEELKAKSRWTPFFAHITPWSREYLVVFDAPLIAAGTAKMVKQDSTILRISSAAGKVAIPYPY